MRTPISIVLRCRSLLGLFLALGAVTTVARAQELRDAYHQAPRDTVPQDVYDGWKQFNLNCARCHGEDVQGTAIAPHLILSLKPTGPINTKELFIQTVCAGRPPKGMPSWCALGMELPTIEKIYLSVREGTERCQDRARPARREARSLEAVRAYLISLLGLVAFASTAPAQTVRPRARLALFDVAFYGKGANSLEQRDPLVAVMTDSILRADLEHSGDFQILDSAGLAQATAQAETGGVDCVTLECRRQVSKKAGAAWMVTSKLSKTSNLIWYLSGQLTDVASGRRLLDDEFELKGIAEDIAKGGAHSLARRIVKAANSASAVDTPTTRMSPAELKTKLAAATEDTAPDLRKANLSGLDLSGVDFKRANLAGARLAGTKLIGANLFTADLTDAVLTDADLSKANLDGSVLRRAKLQRANLEGASLFATIIESADLSNANLAGTRIIGYLRGANLSGANLRRSNAGADPGNQSMGVMRATFVGADLSGADLSDANLFKADLSHANLTNAKLARTNLMNADLIQTDLTRADLTGAKLAKANIDGAIFTQAVGVDRIQGLDQTRNRDKAVFNAK